MSIDETQAAAIFYIERGWQPVPLYPRSKRPIGDAWQDRRRTKADVAKDFIDGVNVGLLTGGASHGLADGDLDTVEARTLASHYLPQTESRFGYDGLVTHVLYIAANCSDFLTLQFRDPICQRPS
ncbi:MAG: bifunctional DNA primase/polymerase [Deltaproteobacteria bacterium]|nr:bifunctional DNA primase/polymerase [Deltaproteobacteria bacterium]